MKKGSPSPNSSPSSNISGVPARSIGLVESVDREIDGNDDGGFGGDYIATVSGSRVTAEGIGLARTQRQPEADAIEFLRAHRELIGLYRSARARNEARLEARVFDIHTGRWLPANFDDFGTAYRGPNGEVSSGIMGAYSGKSTRNESRKGD